MAVQRRPLVSCVVKAWMAWGWWGVNTTLLVWSMCARVRTFSDSSQRTFPPSFFLNYWLYSDQVGAVWRGRLFHNKTIECFRVFFFHRLSGFDFPKHSWIETSSDAHQCLLLLEVELKLCSWSSGFSAALIQKAIRGFNTTLSFRANVFNIILH